VNPDAAGWKLALGYVAWLFAAIAIALILALLVGSIASLFGVDAQSVSHQRVVEVVAVLSFFALAAAPFVVRYRVNRVGIPETDDEGAAAAGDGRENGA
jgi:membrane protein YdbS with pleckstrin-like domain